MTYWTIMIITILSGPLEGSQMFLPYPSIDACWDATNLVSESIDSAYDHSMDCKQTSTASGSIRPKTRP